MGCRRRGRLGRRAVVRPLALLAVLGLAAACAGDDGGGAAGPTRGSAVVVASFNFSESQLLAEIYTQALAAAGVPVQRELDLGPRELVQPALQQGFVDVVPEYLGTALSVFDPGADVDPGDAAAVHAALAAALDRWGLTALSAAPAQNQNGFAVTRQTALRLGASTISDLAVAAGTLTAGGPPECPARRYCLAGVRDVYGIAFGRFMPLEGVARVERALREGVIDVGVVFTTDGALASPDLVVLDDDRGLQPAEHVVPVVSQRALAGHGDRIRPVLDAVSARLTTTALRFLNWRVSVAGKDVAAEARGWLRRHELAS